MQFTQLLFYLPANNSWGWTDIWGQALLTFSNFFSYTIQLKISLDPRQNIVGPLASNQSAFIIEMPIQALILLVHLSYCTLPPYFINQSLIRAMHGKATENEINSKIRIILEVRLQNQVKELISCYSLVYYWQQNHLLDRIWSQWIKCKYFIQTFKYQDK